ncbi:MAG TPA: tripartite tricarboxylate transporter substrate binding protein [Burkholderiaceae bacterium]|nr:tripartite tricarboxylate transporter substrate binding protein [Burkholderiaceae bacterium]
MQPCFTLTTLTRRRVLTGFALGATALMPAVGLAQSWPAKTVTLVVGTPAGDAIDVYARALADQLAKQTGGTFIVENRAGANGNISAESVLKAPADGTTLWIGTASMLTINPAVFSQMRWKPTDFKPLVKGVEAPLVLVAHPSVPATSLEQLAEWVRTQGGKSAYASFSPGTPSHFLGYQLGEKLKLELTHVPYKGTGPQVNDILAGQVPFGFTQLVAATPHIAAGKLRAIAVTGPQRSRFLPSVPTVAELGQPDLTATIWFGLFAPASIPAATRDTIQAAAMKVQADPAYRARLQTLNFDVPDESGAVFEKSIAAESARWAAIVKATGFKAD